VVGMGIYDSAEEASDTIVNLSRNIAPLIEGRVDVLIACLFDNNQFLKACRGFAEKAK
jgi:hypothetical protein